MAGMLAMVRGGQACCRRLWSRPPRCWPPAGPLEARPGHWKRGEPVSWRVITYRLPAEPSRHRVAVWRELRRLGAVPLQQGTWAVPVGEGFDAGFADVVEAITAAGGQPVVLAVAEEASTDQLATLFTEEREAEWGEVLSDCGK